MAAPLAKRVWVLFASCLLYAPGAFFFYPWKPLMQLLVGDTYATGYKYFRRDHSKPTNIVLHGVALVWQLLGNFGFLAVADASLRTTLCNGRPVARSKWLPWPAPQASGTL